MAKVSIIIESVLDAAGFNQTQTAMNGLQATAQKMSMVGASLTAGVTLPVVGLGLATVKAASDFEESSNKMRVVFGKNAQQVTAFTKDAAKNLGLSQQAAIEATSTFGNLFTALGVGQQDTLKMSEGLVQLGADLASFNNISVDEALAKLRSGITGESEPLKALGVDISETAVKAQLLKMGIQGVSGEFTTQQKVMARYALIMEQTKLAHGDFKNTSDSVANSLKTVQGEIGDLSAAFGKELIPVAKDALKVLKDLLAEFNKLPQPIREGIIKGAAGAALVGPILQGAGGALSLVSGIGAAGKMFGAGGAAGGAAGAAGAGGASILPFAALSSLFWGGTSISGMNIGKQLGTWQAASQLISMSAGGWAGLFGGKEFGNQVTRDVGGFLGANASPLLAPQNTRGGGAVQVIIQAQNLFGDPDAIKRAIEPAVNAIMREKSGR